MKQRLYRCPHGHEFHALSDSDRVLVQCPKCPALYYVKAACVFRDDPTAETPTAVPAMPKNPNLKEPS